MAGLIIFYGKPKQSQSLGSMKKSTRDVRIIYREMILVLNKHFLALYAAKNYIHIKITIMLI